MSNKTIIWSGGADSTLLVWRELKEKHIANTLYINTPFIHKIKIASEKIVRNKLKDKAKKNGWVIEDREINIDGDCNLYTKGMPQQTLWTMLACYFSLYENTELVFGFHRKDDALTKWEDLARMKDNINRLMGKNNTLSYPLESTNKYEIIEEIKREKLMDYFFTCENPKGIMKPCGKCVPCINLAIAEYE
jgi:7-cyano-7-deazaguanine synthase in queuosine biosynthesis